MNLHRAIGIVLLAVFVAGLAAAYLSGVMGIAGYISAQTVSLMAIFGASVAFIASVIYFAGCELSIRRRRQMRDTA